MNSLRMRQSVGVWEKDGTGVSPQGWRRLGVARAHIAVQGESDAITDGALFNANVTHFADVEYNAIMFKNDRVLKTEDGTDYLIVHVREQGSVLRRGRSRYMRLALMKFDTTEGLP